MIKGPILNDITRNFTARDSLGIDGVATSISAEICPIVNTVTPRAFYWPFMVWIYYDFYKYSGIKERNVEVFDLYLKRQDYFFVLATLINKNDELNLVGKMQAAIDLEKDGPYPFNEKYFKTRYGGMQYYNAGCILMHYIITEDPETAQKYKLPKLTKLGEEMAVAFESVIKESEYYKQYRLGNVSVPRDVLEEYGKYINIGLKGFDKCKQLLVHSLFETKMNVTLKQSAEYLQYLSKEYNIKTLNREICREVFYDFTTPENRKIIIPDNLSSISKKWEIVIARQYFTTGLGLIWRFMLEQLMRPMNIEEWIRCTILNSNFSCDKSKTVSFFLQDCNYDFNTRERLFKSTNDLENGIKVILSVYNRLNNRADLEEFQCYFFYGRDSQSIALEDVFEIVNEYKEKALVDFMIYVMKKWLIEQHYITAFEKMLQNRDGFFYEYNDDLYIKKHDFKIDFQGIRMIQLMQIMKDLDML